VFVYQQMFNCSGCRQLDAELLSRCRGRRLIVSNASTSLRYHHDSAEMKIFLSPADLCQI